MLVIEKMKEDKRDISSTFVREEIANGNIEKANHLLGYRYFVTGEILHGNHIGAARNLAFRPSTRSRRRKNCLPPIWGLCDGSVTGRPERYRGVTNVGCKPTIEGKNPVGVETHLLDFAGDIYGTDRDG